MKKFLILSLITFSMLFGFFIKGEMCFANADSFNLNTLFVNEFDGKETKASKIHTFESAVGAVVRMITGLIGGFAVLGTILGGFMILISGGSDEGVKKGKSVIIYSLIGIAVSLVSYTLIQVVQMFLFSFQN